MLLYSGMKVKLKDASILVGSLATTYESRGYLFVNQGDCNESTSILVSDCANGGVCNSVKLSNLIPVYDADILSVLESKEKELKTLEREIKDIKNFINTTCKNA